MRQPLGAAANTVAVWRLCAASASAAATADNATALASLEGFEANQARRFEIVERYRSRLGEIPGVHVQAIAPTDRSTWKDFTIAVETNGTITAPDGIDWLCVSPKAGAEIVQRSGDELKLVYPQPDAMPDRFEHLDFPRLALPRRH